MPTTGRFISDARASVLELKRLNEGLSDLNQHFKDLDTSVPTESFSNFNEQLAIGSAVLVGMASAVANVTRAQIEAAVQFERQQVSLQTITGSVEAATAQYERLLEVARLPGIDISQALAGSAQLQAIGFNGERAAEAIGAIGNALATSGQSAAAMTPVISGFRQLNAEGKILQEDLAIITTRIPSLIPLMKEAFGGTRAEDVRKYYEQIGRANNQTELFSDALIEMLATLPTVSNTAGNALENLSDTANRLQARIGTNLLPLVKESAAGIEGLLKEVEGSEGATKAIAVFGSMASSLLGVTSATAGVRAALLLLGPVIPLFTGPVGIAALAVGALTAAFIGWKVATADTKDEVANLNTFIARNTDLIKENTEAVESGSLTEIRASEAKIRTAIDAAEARVKQLRESSEAQFEELRGIKRSEEAFDELTETLRRTGNNLKNAEAELARLNETLRETNAEAQRLEDFEKTVAQLQGSISELQEESRKENLSIAGLLAGDSGAGIDATQRRLAELGDTILRQQDAYNDLAEAARGGDTDALEKIVAIQNVLRNSSQDYFQALQQGLIDASTETEYENVIRLSEAYAQTFGNVDFLSDFVTAFDQLTSTSENALNTFLDELSVTEELAEAYTKLTKETEKREEEAKKLVETLEGDYVNAVKKALAEDERARKQRLSDIGDDQRLGEQLDKKAAQIRKDEAKSLDDYLEERSKSQIKRADEVADAQTGAADRVAERWLDGIDKREKAEEDARRKSERAEERAERRRIRAAEREAREVRRAFETGLSGLAGELEAAFDVGFIESAITAAFGNPLPFIQEWFGGLFDSLNTPDSLNITGDTNSRGGGISEGDLFGGGLDNITVRFASDALEDVEFAIPDFEGHNPLGISLDPLVIADIFTPDQRETIAEIENQRILADIEANTKATADATADERISTDRLTSIMNARTETLENLLRTEQDSPLQNWLDNRQGILRLFSADQMEAFLVGANDLIQTQEKLAEEQLRAQNPELAFLQDLELLLEAAEVDSAGGLGQERINELLQTLSTALAQDGNLSSDAAIAALEELRGVLSDAQILPETIDAFTQRLFDLFEGDGVEIQIADLPEDLKVALDIGDATVGLDPDAEAGLDPDAEAGLDPDAEVGVDSNAEVGVDSNAEVGVDTEGQTIPVDALPEGTEVPIEALPPETKIPIDALPEGTSIPVDALPEGTSIPVDALPEGTSIPVDALPEGISIPVDALPEGISIPVDALPEGTSIPIDALPEGIGVPVYVPEGLTVPVGPPAADSAPDISIRTETEPSFTGLASGSPVPNQAEIDFLKSLSSARLTNDYSPAEIDILKLIGEQDALLPAGGADTFEQVPVIVDESSIAQLGEAFRAGDVRITNADAELKTAEQVPVIVDESSISQLGEAFRAGDVRIANADAELKTAVLRVEAPVELSIAAITGIGNASQQDHISVSPRGANLPVSVDGTAKVDGAVAVKGTATVDGSVRIEGVPVVQLAQGTVLQVEIQNSEIFHQDFRDEQTRLSALGAG